MREKEQEAKLWDLGNVSRTRERAIVVVNGKRRTSRDNDTVQVRWRCPASGVLSRVREQRRGALCGSGIGARAAAVYYPLALGGRMPPKKVLRQRGLRPWCRYNGTINECRGADAVRADELSA